MRLCLQGVENQSRKKHRNVCVKTRTCFSEKSYMFLDIHVRVFPEMILIKNTITLPSEILSQEIFRAFYG